MSKIVAFLLGAFLGSAWTVLLIRKERTKMRDIPGNYEFEIKDDGYDDQNRLDGHPTGT